jgi:hypothetical protein
MHSGDDVLICNNRKQFLDIAFRLHRFQPSMLLTTHAGMPLAALPTSLFGSEACGRQTGSEQKPARRGM